MKFNLIQLILALFFSNILTAIITRCIFDRSILRLNATVPSLIPLGIMYGIGYFLFEPYSGSAIWMLSLRGVGWCVFILMILVALVFIFEGMFCSFEYLKKEQERLTQSAESR